MSAFVTRNRAIKTAKIVTKLFALKNLYKLLEIFWPAIHAFSRRAIYLKLNEIYAEFNWPVAQDAELLCHVSIKKSCL